MKHDVHDEKGVGGYMGCVRLKETKRGKEGGRWGVKKQNGGKLRGGGMWGVKKAKRGVGGMWGMWGQKAEWGGWVGSEVGESSMAVVVYIIILVNESKNWMDKRKCVSVEIVEMRVLCGERVWVWGEWIQKETDESVLLVFVWKGDYEDEEEW